MLITYEKNRNLGNFETCKIGLHMDTDNENLENDFEKIKNWVNEKLKGEK